MTTQTLTAEERITQLGITMTASLVTRNPHMIDPDESMSHWFVTLERDGRTLQTYFSMGAAHRQWTRSINLGAPYGSVKKGDSLAPHLAINRTMFMVETVRRDTEPTPPDAATVLDCLASDASGVAGGQSFEEWADEYGYNTDSRKAESIYRTILNTTQQMRQFLEEHFDAVVFDTERM